MKDLLERFGGPRQATLIAIGLAVMIIIMLVARWATAPNWVPAFQGVPLDAVGKMTEKLDQSGIAYRLTQGGSEIQVADKDMAKARVTLAASGNGVSAAARPGYELFDQPSWGMTDFTQRINYKRALEGEMERTIGKMRGIKGAQVHVTLREASSLRRPLSDKPAQASVVLTLDDGGAVGSDVVAGITHLVAASVDGLKSEDVSVLDDSGRLLSIPNEPGSLDGLSSRQLAQQHDVEQHLESKVAELLKAVVGAGNARIQANVVLNFDRIERTVQSVDPDRQAVATSQKAEIVPGAQGGAGSVNQATAYENSRTTENLFAAVGGVRKLSVAVLVNEPVVYDSATKKSVVQRKTPEELQNIKSLVATTVGADSTRGDQITVVASSFTTPPAEEPPPPPTMWDKVQSHQRILVMGIAIVMAFLMLLLVIKAVMRPAPASAALPRAAQGPGVVPIPTATILAPPPQPLAPPPQIVIPRPDPTIRDAIVSHVDSHPDSAARLIKSWLREG